MVCVTRKKTLAGHVVRFRFICHRDSESVSTWHARSFIKGVDLPEEKRKRLEMMACKNAVRSTIGASLRVDSGRAIFRGCLGTTATMCRPCAIADRAVVET